jgi:hypothetical protein
VEGKDAVGGLFALAGVALILWAITGRRVTIRDVGLRTAPSDPAPGELSRAQRTWLALIFGVLLVAAGVLLVVL